MSTLAGDPYTAKREHCFSKLELEGLNFHERVGACMNGPSYSQALVLPPRSGMHPRSTQHAYTRCAHRSLWSRGLASLWQLRCRGVIRWSCGADNHYFKPTSTSSASAASTTTCRCSPLPFPPLVLPTPLISAACTVHMVSAFCTYDLGDSCASDLGDLYI